MKHGQRRGRPFPPREQSLNDPGWRAFILEQERLSAAADGDWRALRSGLRRLRVKFSKVVPPDAVDQHLAYSVFDHAVHWEVSPRIVRSTFSLVWSGEFDTYLRVSAAAHFWAWAWRLSSADMPRAESAVSEARTLTRRISDPMKKLNLERMLSRLTSPGSGTEVTA